MPDGRGRMSRIEEIGGEIKDTVDRLLRAGTSQRRILDALKPLCEAAGEQPISAGGLNRYATRMASIGQDIREAEAIAGVWVRQFGEEPGQVGQLVIEMLKTVIFKLMLKIKDGVESESETEIEPDDVNALALAIQRLERASAIGEDRLRRIRAEVAKEAAEAAAESASAEAEKAGFKLPPEALTAIREQVYGIYDE